MAQPNLNPRERALRPPFHEEPQSSQFSHQRADPLRGDKYWTGTEQHVASQPLALAEAPLSISKMTRGWLGLLSMSCFVFSNTCKEIQAQVKGPDSCPQSLRLGPPGSPPPTSTADSRASEHRLC